MWPATWESILRSDVAFYRRLRPRERERFRAVVARFVRDKRVVGVDVGVDDRTRLLVAAAACRLALNLPGETYSRMRVVEVQRTSFDAYLHDTAVEVVGTAELHRVVIALDALQAGLREEGRENVGYHEFAHVLDASDGISDGVPLMLADPSLRRRWIEVMTRELARHRAAVEAGEPTVLAAHARKSAVEFFAYATEAFFGVPEDLRAARPELYALLATYYAQEPVGASATFTRDLVAEARERRHDPVFGRDAETRRLLHILERRSKSHPLIVGEPGVGKTALLRGFVDRIANGDVPSNLACAHVLELDTGALVAGANLRGEIEQRFASAVAALRAVPGVERILVVEDLDALFGRGVQGSGVGELLEPLLLRDEIHLLATTTPEGARRIDARAAGLLRRFSLVTLAAPSIERAAEILRGVAPGYGEHHRVRIAEDAILSAVTLAKRYLPDRALPDAALDLLDETSSRKRLEVDGAPVEGAAERSNRVGEDDVARTLADWTGIPVSRMLEGEAQRLLGMEERLSRRVVGQDEAVRAIARAVRRNRVGLRDPGKPIGSFLFLGPSGCGKTELARALAEILFDDEQALTRMDMSEYMERHMAQRLIGAPLGYADSDQGGMLTEAVRRRPYSVLLFDEVEKAHADVLNLLLQVVEDGRLTDGRGRLADFSSTVVIMTSNIGSKRILEADPRLLGTERGREALHDALLDELRGVVRPEFLNRIDDMVVFRGLTKDDLRGVVDIQLQKLERLLADKAIKVSLSDAAKGRLVDLGHEPSLGARPLKRAILRELQNPLAEAILADRAAAGTTFWVDLDGEKLTFTPSRAKAAQQSSTFTDSP
jgi:ATP-dependent Clp protease ATP-binding subunit ClpA